MDEEFDQLLQRHFWPDWKEHFTDEFFRFQDRRAANGLCGFCGADLTALDGAYANKFLPSQGLTCSPECAHNSLMLYCMLEGK